MKTKVIYGMIALLSVSLFFLGCPTDASDDSSSTYDQSGGKKPSSSQAAAAVADSLKDAFAAASSSVNVSVNGSTITLTNTGAPGTPIPLPLGTTTVPSGVTLAVPASEKVTVPPGSILSIAGDLTVGAGVEVTNNGNIEVAGGTCTLGAGVTGTATGTVTVKSGSVIKVGAGAGIPGTTTIVEAGAEIYFNGQTTPFIGTSSSVPAAIFQLGSGAQFTFTINTFAIDGVVTLGSNFLLNASAQHLTIKQGSKLIIPSSITMTLINDPILGETGAQIALTGAITQSGTGNFYASGDNSPEATPQTGKTYEWKADVNGAGPGWEATS
ncbi:hypothetical protein LQZ21_04000 [Treponema sp. TIM-1]|uniref:hypothetical protein n=1 Tax=Treponema sp. TIM-1 TaxID=2898417 RepID=UPI00397F6BD5